jgi:flagellar hook assembly protein FlgD
MSLAHSTDFEFTEFKPKGSGLAKFHIQVFTTWGELVWESELIENGEPAVPWDGTNKNGDYLDEDAYIWKCHAEFINGITWPGMEIQGEEGRYSKVGTITIIR